MLSKKRSEQITHTAPGTPGGELLRRYWHPLALAEEVTTRDPLALTIMHEDLVLVRTDEGELGLMARNCCHRGMDLSFGRVEDGGLRCIYHGWLFAPDGRCLETPGEPEGSQLHKKVRQRAYRVREAGGIIWGYLGPGEPPLFPDLELFAVPREHRTTVKLYQECNYLQALEGNIDPTHQSFLHGFRSSQEESKHHEVRHSVGGTSLTNLTLYAANVSPGIEQENTRYGIRAFITRPVAGAGGTMMRVYNYVMPNYALVPGGAGSDGYTGIYHVPIDDVSHWKFFTFFNRSKPLDMENLRKTTLPELAAPFIPKRNPSNGFLQDREGLGKGGWFAGLGPRFIDHDTCATTMQGAVVDREAEHLGEADKMIARMRKLMLDAVADVKAGKDPLGVIRDAATDWVPELRVAAEFFAEGEDWRATWIQRVEERLKTAVLSR